ncbi:uncharacterized protein DEA37_0002607, partial [Paragonimus westermani]
PLSAGTNKALDDWLNAIRHLQLFVREFSLIGTICNEKQKYWVSPQINNFLTSMRALSKQTRSVRTILWALVQLHSQEDKPTYSDLVRQLLGYFPQSAINESTLASRPPNPISAGLFTTFPWTLNNSGMHDVKTPSFRCGLSTSGGVLITHSNSLTPSFRWSSKPVSMPVCPMMHAQTGHVPSERLFYSEHAAALNPFYTQHTVVFPSGANPLQPPVIMPTSFVPGAIVHSASLGPQLHTLSSRFEKRL